MNGILTVFKNLSDADPDFDGHLEYALKDKSPAEKIEYLWEMILMNRFLKTAAKQKKRT